MLFVAPGISYGHEKLSLSRLIKIKPRLQHLDRSRSDLLSQVVTGSVVTVRIHHYCSVHRAHDDYTGLRTEACKNSMLCYERWGTT